MLINKIKRRLIPEMRCLLSLGTAIVIIATARFVTLILRICTLKYLWASLTKDIKWKVRFYVIRKMFFRQKMGKYKVYHLGITQAWIAQQLLFTNTTYSLPLLRVCPITRWRTLHWKTLKLFMKEAPIAQLLFSR